MRILGQLEHPNVVPLHSLVLTDEAPFCTMRLRARPHPRRRALGPARGRPRDRLPLLHHAPRPGAPPGDPGDRLRAFEGRAAPRSQALERHARRARRGAGPRLGSREGDRPRGREGPRLGHGPHARGRARRDARLHVARAGVVHAGRRALRRLGAGRHDVRDPHARAALRGDEPGRDARGASCATTRSRRARGRRAARSRSRSSAPASRRSRSRPTRATPRRASCRTRSRRGSRPRPTRSSGRKTRACSPPGDAKSSRSTGGRRRRWPPSRARSRRCAAPSSRGSPSARRRRSTRPRTACATRAPASRRRARISS